MRSKLNTLKSIALSLLKRPSAIKRVVDPELIYKERVQDKFPTQLNGFPVVPFVDIAGGESEVEPYSFLDGTSMITDMMLLRALAAQHRGGNYFEIGTWRGESVANVASFFNKCYTLNLPDEAMLEMGLPKAYVDLHRHYSKNIPQVEHLQHNSRTFDFSPYHKQIDLVFVDGDHHYEGVLSDTQNIFPLLRNENSVIVWHDYAFNPEKIRYEVMCGILDGMDEKFHKNLYHVSNTMCALYTVKPLKGIKLIPFQKPQHAFKINVSVSKL